MYTLPIWTSKKTCHYGQPTVIRLIVILSLCHLTHLTIASAEDDSSKLDDPFYKITTHRQNYIFPVHYAPDHKPSPEWILKRLKRIKPILDERLAKKSASNKNLEAPRGHQRKISREERATKGTGMVLEEVFTSEELKEIRQGAIQNTLIKEKQKAQTPQSRQKSQRKIFWSAIQNSNREPAEARNSADRQSRYLKASAKILEEEAIIEKTTVECLTELSEEVNNEDVRDILKKYSYTQPREIAFQISFKFPLFYIRSTDTRVYAAYTQQSWWQAYTGISAFFRETNFMPELFIEQPFEIKSNRYPQIENIRIGFNHQSNGEGEVLEISWNRFFAEIRWRWGRWSLLISPWYSPDSRDKVTYNPDITEHLGHGLLALSFSSSFFQATLQKNLASYQFIANLSASPSLAVTCHIFYGKGSSLILYNQPNLSMGIGIAARL